MTQKQIWKWLKHKHAKSSYLKVPRSTSWPLNLTRNPSMSSEPKAHTSPKVNLKRAQTQTCKVFLPKGASFNILATQSHMESFLEQWAKSECFTQSPVSLAIIHHLHAQFQDTFQTCREVNVRMLCQQTDLNWSTPLRSCWCKIEEYPGFLIFYFIFFYSVEHPTESCILLVSSSSSLWQHIFFTYFPTSNLT